MHGNENGFIGILKTIRFLINMKIITKNIAAKILMWLETFNTSETNEYEKANLPGVYGYAEGFKEGKIASVGVTIDGDINNFSMGDATSLPLATGIKMFIDKKINHYGVHTPESEIFDPSIFFDYLKEEMGEDAVLNTLISRSW